MNNDWKNRITFDPDILKGKPIIKGTRISVELILELLANGWTEQQISENYSQLKKEDIKASLIYAIDLIKEGIAYPHMSLRDLRGIDKEHEETLREAIRELNAEHRKEALE